jgi:hypothetical protein
MTLTRQIRAANYAAKRRAEFTCGECKKRDQLLVCADAEALVVRCESHVGDLEVRPHQWDEAARIQAELRAKG